MLESISKRGLKSRGVIPLIGWRHHGTRFSAQSLLCPRLDSGDPPDALAALSRAIRQHPGRSSRRLADRLRLDGLLGGLGCHDARKINLANLHFRVNER